MRITSWVRVGLVSALPLIAAACSSSEHFAAIPGPAPLTEQEAGTLALNAQSLRTNRPMISSMVKTETGYLVTTVGRFDSSATPPKQQVLMFVSKDGSVREVNVIAQ